MRRSLGAEVPNVDVVRKGGAAMSVPNQSTGAGAEIRGAAPSVDLATLLTLLADAYAPSGAPGTASAWPVLAVGEKTGRLSVNTYGILRRLLTGNGLRDAFGAPGRKSFVQDLPLTPAGMTARIGGRLSDTDPGQVTVQVARLQESINADLDRLGVNGTTLLVRDTRAAVANLAASVNLPDPLVTVPASLVGMQFAPQNRPATERQQDLGRLISAQEEIQADDWLERFSDGIRIPCFSISRFASQNLR